MSHVLTLISSPAAATVTPTVIATAREDLAVAGEPGEAIVLAEGVAVDIPFRARTPLEPRRLAEQIRTGLAEERVDVVVQPTTRRRKRLLVADMDSTMIGQECVDELAAEVGLKDKVAAITERAMRGEIAFEPALRERVALLCGLSTSVIDKVIETRIRLTPGAKALVATMRANGAYTALVSGGFTAFAGRIAAMIGFDESRANRLEISEGKLAGTVAEPILGQDAKRDALIELTARLGLAREETLAVGDGANDLAMIRLAGLGVAFHAKPAVAREAAVRIEHGDLTALLYLQGYRREEIVGA